LEEIDLVKSVIFLDKYILLVIFHKNHLNKVKSNEVTLLQLELYSVLAQNFVNLINIKEQTPLSQKNKFRKATGQYYYQTSDSFNK